MADQPRRCDQGSRTGLHTIDHRFNVFMLDFTNDKRRKGPMSRITMRPDVTLIACQYALNVCVMLVAKGIFEHDYLFIQRMRMEGMTPIVCSSSVRPSANALLTVAYSNIKFCPSCTVVTAPSPLNAPRINSRRNPGNTLNARRGRALFSERVPQRRTSDSSQEKMREETIVVRALVARLSMNLRPQPRKMRCTSAIYSASCSWKQKPTRSLTAPARPLSLAR